MSRSFPGIADVAVLDREARDPGSNREGHVLGHLFGLVRESGLEIGVDGEVHGGGDRRQVLQDVVALHPVVGAAGGPRVPGARRGESLEPEVLEHARAPDVPRVRQDEAAARVQ